MMYRTQLCTAFIVTATVVALLPRTISAFGKPGCYGITEYQCLPGLDAIGVGYDAVTAKYAGNPVVAFNFTNSGKVYPNPFDNGTSYSYADQATVMGHTEKSTTHSVYRSVSEYVSSQSHEAHASLNLGFFKASTETSWASSQMSDGLHIVAVSTFETGLYSITLKPPQLLQADLDMLAYIDSLPEVYDAAEYQKFITYYGTHYPFQVTLGGRAKMNTVISNDFSSSHSDSSISASLSASWGSLGGGGGGSSASNTTSQDWKDNSNIDTVTVGGDPSIDAFSKTTANGQGWANWVKSVEHGTPVVTTLALEPVWSLVPPGPKQDNVMKAVQTYAANVTWPVANLTNIQMSWCDCYGENMQATEQCDQATQDSCKTLGCQKSGYVATTFVLNIQSSRSPYWGFTEGESDHTVTCCRPCFTAQN